MKKKGKVLVTGAGGFNGRYLVEMLKDKGYDVRATDLEAGERTAKPEFYRKLGAEFIPSDLTKPESLEPVLKDVKYILHTASLFDYTAPLELNRKINCEGTRNLCEAAKKAGIKKMILWGTIGVYGTQDNPYVTEEAPVNPNNAYEISKMEQEEIVLEYSRNGDFAATVMRPAPVYGPRNKYGFINIIRIAMFFPMVPVPTKMETRLPSIHVRDVTRAGIFLMEAPNGKTDGEVFTLIDDSNIRLPDFMRLVAALGAKNTIPINVKLSNEIVLFGGGIGSNISELLANITKKRPLIEEATVYYMQFTYRYSNQKLKDIGFKFDYPDCRVGLIEMFDWIKAENMQPLAR